MRPILALCSALFLLLQPLAAQKKELKTKFGKISDTEQSMTSYKEDPSAPAVVLFDKGEVSHRYDNSKGFIMEFERHVRLKIFNKSAYDLANVRIPFSKYQRIADIKAVCYNLENGKLVETELEKANIFEEKLTKNYYVLKFSIPAVKEGSIIEYKYKQQNDNGVGMLPEWEFQHVHIPTAWSEFYAEIPTFVDFKKMSQGWTSFAYTKEEEITKTVRITYSDRSDGMVTTTKVGSEQVDYTVKVMHFIQEKVPALKVESFVASPEDYLAKISFDIRTVYSTDFVPSGTTWRLINGAATPYYNTWERLGEDFMEDLYEPFFKSDKYTEDQTTTVVSGKNTPMEKTVALYEYIGKNYQTLSLPYVWPTQTIERLTKDRKGSATDLNLLFINMLRHAGISAWPVLISTRSHGHLRSFHVSPYEVDRVLAAVEVSDKPPLLVDVSAFPNPIGLLDKEDVNGEGLLLRSKEQVEWIPIQNKVNIRTAVLGDLKLAADGTLSGTLTCSENGYGAVARRAGMQAKETATFVSEAFKPWISDGTVSDIKTSDKTTWNEPSFKTEFKLGTSGFGNASGNKIYLSPALGAASMENPFKNPERKFPVDLGIPHDKNYVLTFALPAGYKVEEAPKPAKIVFGDNALSFEYLVENTPGILKFNIRQRFKNMFIGVDEYENLRQFYAAMVAKLEEQVVLTKE